jgi:beta-fructofuranosidase
VEWHTGGYIDQRFSPQQSGLLDHGAFYAPKSFLTPDGRRILWGWIQETRSEAELARAGWSGVMSLPRVLSVNQRGTLRIEPAVEVNLLREDQERFTLQPDVPSRRALTTLRHELIIDGINNLQTYTLKLNRNGKTLWTLELDGRAGIARCGEVHFKIPLNEVPALRLFIDCSVIECFFGQSEALTSRVYGLAPGESEMELQLTGPGIAQCELWTLKPISPDKLSSEYPAS